MSMHWPVISSDTDTGLKVVRTSRFCPLILITGSFIYPTDSSGSYFILRTGLPGQNICTWSAHNYIALQQIQTVSIADQFARSTDFIRL